MWECISSSIREAVRKYRTGILVAGCSLALFVMSGCEGEYYGGTPSRNPPPSQQDNTSYQDIYWMRQQSNQNYEDSTAELDRIGREAARDTTRINATSKEILYKMQLEK